MMHNAVLKPFSTRIKKYLLILVGSITWSWTMIKSGWFYSTLGTNGSGFGFWGANGHDGIWHVALIESLSRQTLQMPIFAGAKLQNYHIGFDLILAILHKVTLIPVLNLYFQIIPILLAFLIGILTYQFVREWKNSDQSALLATFFVYFGGSFGWIIGRGESTFWSQQAISSLINPPFTLSLVLILLGLLIILRLEKKFTIINFILSIIVFGSLIEIKAYAGVLIMGGLFVSGLYSYLLHQKTLILKIFIGSLILSIFLYLPLNSHASGLLVFQPFWFLESMMGFSDRLNWQRFYSAMQSYRSGNNYFKGIPAYLIAFAIFWIGNMGTRIIKEFTLFKWFKDFKKLSWLEIFIVSVIVAGGAIPLFFLQKGTPWNTIQFFYYSLFLSSILAGVTLSQMNNRWISIVVVLLTIPTTLITLKDVYIPNRPPAMLGNDEIAALNFLSKEPQGIVLTKPFDESLAKDALGNPPRPLYLYTTTAYVSAFSKHQTFLEDENNLEITGFSWQERRNKILNWYTDTDFNSKREFLRANNIRYIYWIKVDQFSLDLKKFNLENIYENNLIAIYRVD